ncbi:neural cell adhesion molecule 1a isoform X2 [Hoplias malabaricus]|uniref:neural cell adhesion molecule 1a isoform X2 n=1 Tax=Hoplias malabaricus TaxID=27720 RepID=UPI003461A405
MLQTRDLVWTLLFLGSTVSLQVEITPPHGEISVGESKFFLCEVVGDVKEIDWFAPNGEKLLPNRQDISVSRSDETSSTLTIYSATVDNAGIYKCVAKDGEKETQATVNVKIYQKLTFQHAPSPQEFNEGDDADIVCDVISSPPPTIIWKYKRAKIQPEKDVRFKVLSNNHLQIRGIKKTDEGDYTCEGRIMARGEIDLRVIRVIVNVLPTIRTRYSSINATADIGQSVMLACYADGYPEPTVTWAHNNVVMVPDEKYSLNDDGSELTIKDVKKVDEGEYVCIARNKAGEKEEEVSLTVFVQPKITYLENQTASELEEQITLTCEATGDPTPSIVWSFGRRVFSEEEQSLDGNVVVRSDARVSSLTLKYVQFTDAGQYLCTARNSIGQDIQSMYLEVRYAPKIQGAVTVFTWEGNAANISCEVLAHPGASVLWFREGQQLPGVNTTNIKIYNTPAVSYLEVTPESQSDFGSYNCTATNLIGTESKEFLLIQAEVPSAPSIERVTPYPSTAQVEFDEPDSSGGVPILKYKAEWRMAGQDWISKEYEVADGLNLITIVELKPETKYEVKLSAINGKGEGDSCPPETFKTQPVTTTGSSLGTGAIVGILIVVFLLLLFGVDVTCYFLNKCGLLMCIAVNFCGKSGPTAKGKDVEEGKAAFTKDESKEPIVEVRTEEERTPNHEGGAPLEPNETTPLTDPEHAADTTATVVDLLPSLATNSEAVTDSPASESTTLTSSTAPSAAEPKAAPQSSTPKASVSSPTSPPAAVAPLVDLSDGPSTHSTKPSEAPTAAPTSESKANSVQSAGAKSPAEASQSPLTTTGSQQVEGAVLQSSDTDAAHRQSDSTTAQPAPNQDDGKIIADEKSKSEETEVKKPPAEVKTVPNEAPQTNGNESKA